MKKLRENLDKWFAKLDDRWGELPVKRQHKYTLYFFLGYLLLTTGVILNVWYNAGKSDPGVVIQHIENPVLKMKESAASVQDSLSNILKNRIYERK